MTTNELYHSNNGKGPGVARVVEIRDGVVQFEYTTGKRWVRHALPLWFWKTKNCGWRKGTPARKRVQAAGNGE